MGLQNGTRVPKGGFAGVFAAEKWGFGCEIGLLRVLNGFAAAKWRLGLRNGTCVPNEGFAAAKIFVEGGYEAAK